MNTLVNDMVELLFKNTQESDEVCALRDELLANCNAHYEDLIRRGVSEQEALSAVAESLQGMEEVVSQYPAKTAETAAVTEAAPEAVKEEIPEPVKEEAAPAVVTEIRLSMKAWDVQIVPSENGRVNVHADGERADLIDIRFDKELLTITEKDDINEPKDFLSKLQKLNFESFEGLIKSVRGVVTDVINTSGGTVRIEVPTALEKIEHHSSSGNLQVKDVVVKNIAGNSASGDTDVSPAEVVESMKFHAASGDIAVTGKAKNLEMESMSGDVHATGVFDSIKASSVSGDAMCAVSCPVLKVSSVSGDVKVDCGEIVVEEANLQSTSGDICFTLLNTTLRRLNAQTVSGDIAVFLPADGQPVHLEVKTLSGDTWNEFESAGPDAPVYITAKSMSGDIAVKKA